MTQPLLDALSEASSLDVHSSDGVDALPGGLRVEAVDQALEDPAH